MAALRTIVSDPVSWAMLTGVLPSRVAIDVDALPASSARIESRSSARIAAVFEAVSYRRGEMCEL